MNFTSQVCTSRSQSERLLALGLKKETADCVMMYYDGWHIGEAEHFDFDKDPVEPAWSLHRLWQMIPNRYTANDLEYLKIAAYEGIGYELPMKISAYGTVVCPFDNIYDSAIYVIEELIKKGSFNKEYLEE